MLRLFTVIICVRAIKSLVCIRFLALLFKFLSEIITFGSDQKMFRAVQPASRDQLDQNIEAIELQKVEDSEPLFCCFGSRKTISYESTGRVFARGTQSEFCSEVLQHMERFERSIIIDNTPSRVVWTLLSKDFEKFYLVKDVETSARNEKQVVELMNLSCRRILPKKKETPCYALEFFKGDPDQGSVAIESDDDDMFRYLRITNAPRTTIETLF
ncbi:MAG: hypothetical protein S4CHLAM6_14010 [Chlamydiae bacterium]|nr:hypothetical protein [Chlamydiota bacterium]